MDKQRIGLIGALVIVAIALIGGIVLTAEGIEAPGWLVAILTTLGAAFAWFVAPPGSKGGK